MKKHFLLYILAGFLAFIWGCDSHNNDASQDIPGDQVQSVPAGKTTEMKTVSPAAPVKAKPAGDTYFEAAFKGDFQTLESEILAGVNVNAVSPDGQTALMLAAFNGHTNLVEMLITHGSDVNTKDQMNRTALMYAASGPNDATVKLLLDKNAEVNVVDNHERWTALMFAAAEGQTGIVQMLLDKQADLTAKDVDGETARDFALSKGHNAVVKILDAAAGTKQK